MNSVVQVGNYGALCLKVEDTFGVVYISSLNNSITCATCKFSKYTCKHVVGLHQLLNTEDEMDSPKALLPFINAYNQDKSCRHVQLGPPSLSCISKKKIPFDLPSNLCSVLLMSSCSRFNIVDGTALLVPEYTAICNKCNMTNWNTDPILSTTAKIVTVNSFIPANGNNN